MASGSSVKKPRKADMAQAVESAISGPIEPVQVSQIYTVGLFAVALAMVILPLLYLALIALVACGTYYYAVHGAAIFHGGGYIRGKLALYILPLALGCIVTFFLVKPLLARRAKAPKPFSLDPAKEPVFFAFVQEIATAVGAPVPRRIDMDCEVNASASFRRGLLSFLGNDLVLTVGLPLVSGLDARQLAGVLAHELGHFAQGAGMRLTYIIRSVNFWFVRVVYERDRWDESLLAWSRDGDVRSQIFGGLARLMVWLSRKVLWALMHIGHILSCFMLRQMEYDADRYGARLAGSDQFDATNRKIILLSLASNGARHDLGLSWQEQRLCDDLPMLIHRNISQIPAEVTVRVDKDIRTKTTGLFDTHPCDADRLKSVLAEESPGVFHLNCAATRLFADYQRLCTEATFAYYTSMGLSVTQQNLVPTEQVTQLQQGIADGHASAVRYCQGLAPAYPLFLSSQDLFTAQKERAPAEAILESRTEFLAALDGARAAFKEFDQADTELAVAAQATDLLKAGLKLPDGLFGRPIRSLVQAEQLNSHSRDCMERNEIRLEGAMAPLRRRLCLGLQLLKGMQAEAPQAIGATQVLRCLETFTCLQDAHTQIQTLRFKYNSMLTLAKSYKGNEENGPFMEALRSTGLAAWQTLAKIQFDLATDYPFDHAGGVLVSLGHHLVPTLPAAEALGDILDASEETIRKFFAFYIRMLGLLCTAAEWVETSLGLSLLEEPPKQESQ